MADFLENERQLFKEIETGNGLNEGDILKAIERLDAEIKQEEDLQASEDLSIATNQNVNPEVAAKFAGLAGTNITTGDQLKKAKPILQRMSKTLTDPNIPADVRESSLTRDREDLEQITIRSTVRDGQKGAEVTGAIPSESPLFDRPERGPVQFEEGRGKFISPEDAPFFPEPDKPERQQETEAFLQTLEPETTILSGPAGQQQLADKRRRNELRKAEFQASRGKRITVKPGEQIFDVKPGEAKPLGGVDPTIKAPTKASVEGSVLQKVMQGVSLTPGEQIVHAGMRKKGFRVTLPNGTVVEQGGSVDGVSPTPTFKTQIQKATFRAQVGYGELLNLKKKISKTSFGAVSSLQKGIQEVFEFFIPGSTPEGIAKPIKDRDKLFRQSSEAFALRIKELTGVQFGEKEAERLKKSFPHSKDNYAEFNNKLDDLLDSYERSLARLIRQGIPIDSRIGSVAPSILKAAVNSVPLGAITQAEIDNVRLLFKTTAAGADSNKGPIPRDLAIKIFNSTGGDKALATKIATDLGYQLSNLSGT